MNLAFQPRWGLALALLLAVWGLGIPARQCRGAEEPLRDTKAKAALAGARPEARLEEKRLLEAQIKLVDKLLAEQQQRIKVGTAPPETLIEFQRQRLRLERELAGLEPGSASLARQKELLTEEIQLAEKNLAIVERRVEVGKATLADIIPVQRELLGLRRELLVLGKPAPPPQERLPSKRETAERPSLADEALQRGIMQEESDLDLNAAAASYRGLIAQFDAQRPLAANAMFRLGECYRRLGRADEANAQYARLLREFPDQTYLVKLAQKYAANALPPANAAAGTRPAPSLSSGDERAVLEWQLAQARNELLLAKSKWMEAGPKAESMAKMRRDNLVSEEEARLANVALDTAKAQIALWSGEVARLERRLEDLQKTSPAASPPPTAGVAVEGQVKQPGLQSIPAGGLTLSQAILGAGGLSDFADAKKVKITRRGPGNTDQIIFIDLRAILDKGQPDVKLEPGDLVSVPSRRLVM